MIIKSLTLQNFRNYPKATFSFSPQTTIIIGPNGIGKSNLMESLFLLATGKSFRAEKEKQLIQFEKQVCRISAEIAPGPAIFDVGPVAPHPRPTASASLAGARRGSPSRVTHSEGEDLVDTEKLEIVFAD